MIILAATPIGNLGDASRRLIEELERATIVAAEDTRTAQRLLAGLGIVNRPRLIALHDHNEKERAPELVRLARDQDVLVLSDAGMPTVSDPGYGLVAAAAAAGVTVTAIPGPSAVLTALAVSGLPTDRFTFEGFVARKQGERTAALRALAAEPRTMIFFEAPTRVAATLAELVTWAEGGVRGELVIVVAGAEPREIDFPDAVAQVLEMVRTGVRLKDAAAEVAAHTGHSSRELYQAALAARGA